jgi:hypothetical protein
VRLKTILKLHTPRFFKILKLCKTLCFRIFKLCKAFYFDIKNILTNPASQKPQFDVHFFRHLSFPLYSGFPLNTDFTVDVAVREILPASPSARLLVILPGVRSGAFSGGPNTALLLAAEVAKADHGVLVLSMEDQGKTCSTQTLRNHLCSGLKLPSNVAEKFETASYTAAVIHHNDKILATRYDTALIAHTLSQQTQSKRFAYLLQDFEPMFFPWNEDHALAAASYEADFLPIINEPLLADFFINSRIGRFADSDFKKNILTFSPAVDRTCFFPEERPKGRHTLLFYARPYSAPRNLSHLGFEALSILVDQGVLNAAEWDVLTMGEPTYFNVPLGKGVESRNLGWMGFTEYTKCVRAASVGLSLMLSPHTSYLPLEFAACGIPVVTNCYANKTPEALNAISPSLIGSALSPQAIAKCLETAILRAQENCARQNAGKLALPATWEESFAPVAPGLLAFMAEQ